MDQPSNPTPVEADGTLALGDQEVPAANAGAENAPNLFVAPPLQATVDTHPAVVKAFHIFHVKVTARTCMKLGRETNLAMSLIDCVKNMTVEHRLRVARGVLDDLITEADDDSFPDMTMCHGDYVYIIIGLWTSATVEDTESQSDRKNRVTRRLESLTEENLAQVRVSVQHHGLERPVGNEAAHQAAAAATAEAQRAQEARAAESLRVQEVGKQKERERVEHERVRAETDAAQRAAEREFLRAQEDRDRVERDRVERDRPLSVEERYAQRVAALEAKVREAEARAIEERHGFDEERRYNEARIESLMSGRQEQVRAGYERSRNLNLEEEMDPNFARRRAEFERERQPSDAEIRQAFTAWKRGNPGEARPGGGQSMGVDELSLFFQGLEGTGAITESDSEDSCMKSLARHTTKAVRLLAKKRHFMYPAIAEHTATTAVMAAWAAELLALKVDSSAGNFKFDDLRRLERQITVLERAHKAMHANRDSASCVKRRHSWKVYQELVDEWWGIRALCLNPHDRIGALDLYEGLQAETTLKERSRLHTIVDYDKMFATLAPEFAKLGRGRDRGGARRPDKERQGGRNPRDSSRPRNNNNNGGGAQPRRPAAPTAPAGSPTAPTSRANSPGSDPHNRPTPQFTNGRWSL